ARPPSHDTGPRVCSARQADACRNLRQFARFLREGGRCRRLALAPLTAPRRLVVLCVVLRQRRDQSGAGQFGRQRAAQWEAPGAVTDAAETDARAPAAEIDLSDSAQRIDRSVGWTR